MAESRHCPPISRFCRPEAPHPRPEAAASVCLPLLSVYRSWWGTWLPHLCGLILHTISMLVAPGQCPRIPVGSTCSPDLLATPLTRPLGDPLLFDLSILPPQLPAGAPGRLSMTSPPLIVGEMTAWGLSEPCWDEARTWVSRLCSWAQDLSCLPWASRASPASARADSHPSWCLFWVQTTHGGPRSGSSSCLGPRGRVVREDPEELLFRPGPVASCSQPACPLLLSRRLSQPLVSRGVVTAACPVTDLKRAALSTGEWRAASHLPLRSIGVCVVEVCVCVCVCVLGVTLDSGPWCAFPPRTSLGCSVECHCRFRGG